jgi:hypothetical protein
MEMPAFRTLDEVIEKRAYFTFIFEKKPYCHEECERI